MHLPYYITQIYFVQNMSTNHYLYPKSYLRFGCHFSPQRRPQTVIFSRPEFNRAALNFKSLEKEAPFLFMNAPRARGGVGREFILSRQDDKTFVTHETDNSIRSSQFPRSLKKSIPRARAEKLLARALKSIANYFISTRIARSRNFLSHLESISSLTPHSFIPRACLYYFKLGAGN